MTQPGVSVWNILLILLYLVLIIVAAYFATKAVARLGMKRGMRSTAKSAGGRKKPVVFGQHVNVVDRIAIDRDKSILVVEFDGKFYLLSSTADTVRLIDKKDIPAYELERRAREAREEEEQAAVGEQPPSFWSAFKQNFRRVCGRDQGNRGKAPGQPGAPSFDDEFRRAFEDERQDEVNRDD